MVRDAALDRALQLAAGDVDRIRDSALLVLVGLTDVEHHRPGLPPHLIGALGPDLTDTSLGLLEELTEAGHL